MICMVKFRSRLKVWFFDGRQTPHQRHYAWRNNVFICTTQIVILSYVYSCFKTGCHSHKWNQNELCGSSSSSDLLLLVLTLPNIECSFNTMPRLYSNKLRWRIITHYIYSFRFQYRLLSMTTFFEIAEYLIIHY